VTSTVKRAQPARTSAAATGRATAKSAGGKVVPQQKSLPAGKARGASLPPKGKGAAAKGYQGPLNLGGIGKSGAKGPPSVAGSKTEYQGPLNLGGMGKGGAKGPPSVAGSKTGYQGPLDLGGLGK
jgi:hypothetical protein